jgi:hypothetical protein
MNAIVIDLREAIAFSKEYDLSMLKKMSIYLYNTNNKINVSSNDNLKKRSYHPKSPDLEKDKGRFHFNNVIS